MAVFDPEQFTKMTAESVVNNVLFNGKSIREWIEIIDSEDCISRKEVLKIFGDDIHPLDYLTNGYVDAIKKIPPVINIRIKED